MNKNIFRRYLSIRVLPIWTILIIDVLIVIVSCLLTYFLRSDFTNNFTPGYEVGRTVCWAVGVNLIFFRVFRTYLNVLRFSSFIDIMRIFMALSVGYGILTIANFISLSCFDYQIAAISVFLITFIDRKSVV